MLQVILRCYRVLFAKRFFYKLNKLLYLCSLRGLGVLNYENDIVSGEARFLKKILKNRVGSVVFDVGANVGNYSRKVFEICPLATLYAFEPHPKTFLKLTTNLERENFHAVNVAAGDGNGTMPLYDYEDQDGSSHASLYRDVIENIHQAKSVEHKIQVISLGDFARGKHIEKIDLLKIDTEGNELKVLKGIIDFLGTGKIETIHFEFNEMNVSSRTYFRDFWELLPNYDFYRLLPNGLVKIESYSPIFCEIFAYQNIVAILKHNSANP